MLHILIQKLRQLGTVDLHCRDCFVLPGFGQGSTGCGCIAEQALKSRRCVVIRGLCQCELLHILHRTDGAFLGHHHHGAAIEHTQLACLESLGIVQLGQLDKGRRIEGHGHVLVIPEIERRSIDGKIAVIGNQASRIHIDQVCFPRQQAGFRVLLIEQTDVQRNFAVLHQLIDEQAHSVPFSLICGIGYRNPDLQALILPERGIQFPG